MAVQTTGNTWCYCRVVICMYHNCYEMFNEVVKCQLDKPSHKACSLAGLVLVQADPPRFFFFFFFSHADSM